MLHPFRRLAHQDLGRRSISIFHEQVADLHARAPGPVVAVQEAVSAHRVTYAITGSVANVAHLGIEISVREACGDCDRQFPHCDSRVLHRRGECKYCDTHPDWQELRQAWGIAFTGHTPLASLPVCGQIVEG